MIPKKISLSLLSMLLFLSTTYGQVPQLINYQGFLTDQNDQPLNTRQTIQFAMYSTASGGSALWTETHSNVNVENGLYSITLGSINQIPASIFNGGTRYLGIRVGNDSEMAPRHQIVSVGYAIQAETANDVPDGSITSADLDEVVEFGKFGTRGKVSVKNSSGLERGILAGERLTDLKDSGSLNLYDNQNQRIIRMAGSVSNEQDDPNSGAIWLYENGNQRATLQAADWGGGLWLNASDNNTRVFAGVSEDKAGYQNFRGENGNENISLSSVDNHPNNGGIWLKDTDGNYKATVQVNQDNGGRIILKGNNGNTNVYITSNNSRGSLYIDNENGDTRATLQLGTHGSGALFGFQSDGDRAYTVGTYRTNQSSSATEAGWLVINDENGNEVIEMRGNNGSITAIQKNFRMDHPNDPTKEIYYSCIEGPEVASYFRGTARLNNGEANIQLPEHFSLVTSEQGLTVQLTPLSSTSKGLAVTNKSTREITVKELFEGQGNYEFDYLIQGIRQGFENFQVVRDKSNVLSKQGIGNKSTDMPVIDTEAKEQSSTLRRVPLK